MAALAAREASDLDAFDLHPLPFRFVAVHVVQCLRCLVHRRHCQGPGEEGCIVCPCPASPAASPAASGF